MYSRNLFIMASGVICLFAATGCGSKLAPLTEGQKATLKETIRGADSAFQASGTMQNLRGGPILSLNAVSSYPQPQDNPTLMAERLRRGFETGKCVNESKNVSSLAGNSNANSSGPSGSYSSPQFKISGTECPINMNLRIESEEKSFSLHIDYKVLDSDYLALSDIDQAIVDMNASSNGENSGSGQFKANFHTQKYGEIQVSGKFSGSDKSATASIRFDYKDFSAELGAEMDTQGVKYTLNGQEVTEAEMREYLNGRDLSDIRKSATSPGRKVSFLFF